MKETFHMTRSIRIGSTILMALVRAGVPLGSLILLSVRGRKSGKVSTTPVARVEQDGTRFLVAAFGEVSWVRIFVPQVRRSSHAGSAPKRAESLSLGRERQHQFSSSFSQAITWCRLSHRTLM